MRSSYGRIKREFQKSGNAPSVLKYRAAWIWKQMAFLKPYVRNKTPGVITGRDVSKVQEGEDDEKEEIDVLDDDDDWASILSSAVSVSAAPQSRQWFMGRAWHLVLSRKFRLAAAILPEYLRKTAPETAIMHNEISQSTPRFTFTSQQESNILTVFEHTIPRDLKISITARHQQYPVLAQTPAT
ncbi:unnamed protein product [Mytilus coruscus]|uniref:Uncharacterized protein n=1 Tax=Mytilus coruscus TaxID=42192 RepID=A0A6J7ZR92_MYTCO|nr:unnamed protein product [Mytilus coruscus]